MGVTVWRWSACALWLATAANAQYVATTTSGVVYPALSAPAPIMLTTASGSPTDKGRATIGLGFTFPYYDKLYTSITVTANGLAFLEPSTGPFANSDFSANVGLSNVSEPNGVIAPLWDDLDGKNPTSTLQHQQVSGPNGQGLVIEWSKWSYWTGNYDLTFQLRLWENGLIDFFYGSLTGTGSNLSATVGIEAPNGSAATQGRLCGSLCRLSDLPSNAQISFGPPVGVDLLVPLLKVNSVTPSGADLLISTSLTVRNFGTAPSGNFSYRLYLSSNTTFEAGIDIPLGAAQGPLSLAPMASTEHTASNTVPRPMSGTYYVIAVVDDAGAITETNEVNNVGANASALAPGVDLVAQGITGPPLGGPGELITTHIEFSNVGLDNAGSVLVDVWLSADAVLGPSDIKVFSSTITVAGGQNVNQPVSFSLPTNIAAGEYYFILQLDQGPAAGMVAESDNGNNVKTSATSFTARQADLLIDSVTVLEPAPPYLPAANAFFGESIRVEAVVRNAGGATANNVSVRFYLSDNETLNGFSDPLMGEVTGISLAPAASKVITTTTLVPTLSVGGVPLLPARYYFFAAAIAPNLVEVNASNNANRSLPQKVGAPAPDLVPLSIIGPDRIGAGEAFAVARAFANRGNRPAPNVSYRYYLSANTLVTPDDIPLKIVTSAGLVDDASFALAVGQHNVGTDVVFVPASVPQATYYLGVLVDPPLAQREGEVREVDEDNNGLATQTVDIAPIALGLGPAPLPDALKGLPYDAQLSGQGGTGTYSFALAPQTTLPPGLMLASNGRLSGLPTETGVHSLLFQVTSGTRTALAVRALRVVAPGPALTILTRQLPTVAKGVAYDGALAAAGGVAPYRWSIDSGGLPAGLILEGNGEITGSSMAPLGTETSPVFRVSDAVGNKATALMKLTVVDASALRVVASTLADGAIGSPFAADLVAENVNHAPLERPITWQVVQGALPPGLVLEPQEDRALIGGTPTVAGLFVFSIEVNDAKGRSDSADFVVRIHPSSFSMHAEFPQVVGRGSEVDVTISMDPPVEGVAYAMRAGNLPAGLQLDSTGRVQGKVDDGAPFGVYTFTVEAGRDGSADSMASWAIEVSEKGANGGRCGCGSSPALSSVALILATVFLRRRKSLMLRRI